VVQATAAAISMLTSALVTRRKTETRDRSLDIQPYIVYRKRPVKGVAACGGILRELVRIDRHRVSKAGNDATISTMLDSSEGLFSVAQTTICAT